MAFEFLEELHEARLYRTVNNIKHVTLSRLADNFFNAVLAISVMNMIHPKAAQRYAAYTIQIGNIDKWRMTDSDLHNLAYMLLHQDQFASKMTKDRFVSLPKLQYTQWLRNISNGKIDREYERRFLLRLQKDMGIHDAGMRTARRVVADWELSTDEERKLTLGKIYQHLRQEMQQADLFIEFQKSMTKKGTLITDVPAQHGIPIAAKPGSLTFIDHLPSKSA